MEKEIRNIFSKQIENFELQEETITLKRRLEEILVYEYKTPNNVDSFMQVIDILSKKILNQYVQELQKQMEERIYYINKINGDNTIQNKETRIFEILESRLNFSPESILDDFINETLRPFRTLSEQRGYEYLYSDLKKSFLMYVDNVSEKVVENNNSIKKALQNISISKQDFKHSKTPVAWEMLGINFDEDVKKFWVYEDNNVDKKELMQHNKHDNIFILDSQRHFVIDKKPNGAVLSILNYFDVEKQITIDTDELNCKIGDSIIVYNYKENKMSIKNQEEQASFDLNEINREEKDQLRHMLTEISPDVRNYFERINVVKSYASEFK